MRTGPRTRLRHGHRPLGPGSDETTYAVVKHLNGFLYLVASGCFKDATLGGLADNARLHSVNQVIIEANFGDGMFPKLFQPVCEVVPDFETGA